MTDILEERCLRLAAVTMADDGAAGAAGVARGDSAPRAALRMHARTLGLTLADLGLEMTRAEAR